MQRTADELESVVPSVVRNVGDREYENQKAVVYQESSSCDALRGLARDASGAAKIGRYAL